MLRGMLHLRSILLKRDLRPGSRCAWQLIPKLQVTIAGLTRLLPWGALWQLASRLVTLNLQHRFFRHIEGPQRVKRSFVDRSGTLVGQKQNVVLELTATVPAANRCTCLNCTSRPCAELPRFDVAQDWESNLFVLT